MTLPTKVFLADSGRHRKPTGYGKNARSLIRTLGSNPGVELAVQQVDVPWEVDDDTRLRMGAFEERSTADVKKFDVVLYLGTPNSCRRYAAPTLSYSYCDTLEVPQSFIDGLALTDGVIAPNSANFAAYKKHFKRVYFAQPGIDEGPFRRVERFKLEKRKEFTFIFVGSFAFRKGVDVMIDAFIQEFEPDEAHLYIHIPGEQTDRAANQIFERSAQLKRAANVSLSSANLSEAWMARFYNRADCFITCTRGEGWGLSSIEAMLCELPVISAFGSAMADYLNPEVGLPIDFTMLPVLEITNPLGTAYRKNHGFEGNAIHEPSLSSTRKQMRYAFENREAVAAIGAKARRHVLANFSEALYGKRIFDAITQFLSELNIETAPAA